MEDYKQYLNDNADEDERRAAEQVMKGLAGLRLEAKVREVAAERAALQRRAFWRRIGIFLTALVLLAGAVFLIFRKKETHNTTLPPQQDQRQVPPANNQGAPTSKPDNGKVSEPIAQLRPADQLPNPRHAAPEVTMIRGDEAENKAKKALLNKLWYTDYPLKGLKSGIAFKKADENLKSRNFTAAYIEIEGLEAKMPENDTLRYLKGYCLLEMGEGKEALSYFDKLQKRHAAWEAQLQWYRGLAMLLADERSQALMQFKEIAANPKHPYNKEAVKAVEFVTKRK